MFGKDKTSFVLYTSFYDALQDLPLDRKGMLLDLIFNYEIHGNTAAFEEHFKDLPNDVKMAFRFIKGQLDKDQEKWRDVCSKRADAGKKSASVRWGKQPSTKDNKDDQDLTKITNVNFVKNKITKITDNEYEYEDDNDVVVKTTTARARVATTNKKRQSKFYVPGRTDAECCRALMVAQKFTVSRLIEMAKGIPRDVNLNGNPIWEFDEEMDVAVAYWILKQTKQKNSEREQ